MLGRAIEEARAALAASIDLEPPFDDAVVLLRRCVRNGGKILVCGNGGSAATAQHLTAELVGRYREDRPAISAIALTGDGVTLSAVANDYGYREVFERQIEAIGRPGDVLVAVSTSGRSPNVLRAASRARSLDLPVVALTGPSPCELDQLADISLAVPTCETARIQEVHAVVAHALAEAIDASTRPDARR